MRELLEAILQAITENRFIDFTESDATWRVGVLYLRTASIISKRIIDQFSELGFEYIGKRNARFIFKKKIIDKNKSDEYTSLQELYEQMK